MVWIEIIWDLEDEPTGNVRHIAENGVTQDEVREVLFNPLGDQQVSRSSGRPIVFGVTESGRVLAVVYEEVEFGVVYPITAYEVGETL